MYEVFIFLLALALAFGFAELKVPSGWQAHANAFLHLNETLISLLSFR